MSEVTTTTAAVSNDWPARGPHLWADLHRWALAADLSAAQQWLDRFAHRIPCGDCRRHWQAIVTAIPAPLDSHDALFAWTVARHNQVNRRLGKPQITFEQAKLLWSAANAAVPAPSPSPPPRSYAAPPAQWRQNRRRVQPAGRSAPHGADPGPMDLSRLFDAVWCINLDADADRWADFQRQLAACDWPFCPVTRFSAVHGDTVGVPDHYHQGGGAWGCLQSHRAVLQQSLMAGHRRILVMEDDVDLRPHFGAAARKFLTALGREPWDCLMFGGQHMSAPTAHQPGVVRAANIQRTHCMAFSRGFARELYRYWSGPLDQHCDWALGPFAARFRTFAPEKFIVGQRGGRSWITGGQKPPEWWNPPSSTAPVIWLRSPRRVIESCRDLFHAGNRRNSAGVCVGLADVFNAGKHPTEPEQIAALKNWITMIQWEVESRGDGSVATIWHPSATADVVRAAAGGLLREVIAETEELARQWADLHLSRSAQ